MDERPENTDRLAYELGAFMFYESGDVSHTLDTSGQALLDGPLSDLSILVHIPKVREIAELLADIINYSDPFIDELREALEATDG